MNEQIRFDGLIPATITPFTEEGALDRDEMSRHVERVASHDGVVGVAALGNAGEIIALDEQERSDAIRAARAGMPPGKTLIAGIDGRSAEELVRAGIRAREAGADALLVLPPFDVRPLRHLAKEVAVVREVFGELDAKVGLPMVVFQYPERLGCAYSPEALEAIAELPSLVAVKLGTGNITHYAEIHDRLQGGIAVLAAADSPLLLSMLVHGATGALVGISTVGTPIWAELVARALRNELTEAAELFRSRCLPLTTAIYHNQEQRTPQSAYGAIKEALFQLGELRCPVIRKPAIPPDAARKDEVTFALKKAGLL